MSRNRSLLFGIVVVSVISGLLIGYLTRGTTLDSQPFATMATVQGAFIGIVFSIFVLASQVSATQFTPLTLEQLSKSRGFALLLGFYIFSILTDIYLMQSLSVPISLPYFPQDWNLALAVGAGLMTGSLFSLLIARQLLAELTTPEHLLERTADSVSRETFLRSEQEEGSRPTPPERTPLFTIERILITAHKNGDEFTVQQAIHQLWRGVDRILTPSSHLKPECLANSPPSHVENIDIELLLDHWSTAVTYGTKGTQERVQQTITAHRYILETLIRAERVPEAIEELSNLYELAIASLDQSGNNSILSEYQALSSTIADHESSELLSRIITHHAEFVEMEVGALQAAGGSELDGLDDVLLSDILCNYIELLEDVWESELSSSTNRQRTDLIINQMTSDLESIFETFDEHPNPGPHKQTLLTELQDRLIHASSTISTNAEQPIERYITLVAEVSLSLDRDPDTVARSLNKKVKNDSDRQRVLNQQLKNWSSKDTYQSEFEVLAINKEEITEFVESIATEISSLEAETTTE
ncbi:MULTISPECIES: DUF2254 family protein [Halobacteriales]|nr:MULTISPECIES: DUF2254 family protein [Halobacteria]